MSLWLFHGGELINLYSTDKIVPTKDIDLKLYFTGDYSIDPKVIEKASSKVKPIHLRKIDFTDTSSSVEQYNTITKGFQSVLSSHKTPSGKTAWDIWSQGAKLKETIY